MATLAIISKPSIMVRTYQGDEVRYLGLVVSQSCYIFILSAQPINSLSCNETKTIQTNIRNVDGLWILALP